MPILPVVDLFILVGTALLFTGALLKAVYVTTNYRPTLLGLGPMECAIGAAVFLLLVLALAARTWVKTAEAQRLGALRTVRGPADDFAPHGTGESVDPPAKEGAPISPAGGAG